MTNAPHISIPLLSCGLLCLTTVFPEAPLLPAQSPGLEDHLVEGYGLPLWHPPCQNFKATVMRTQSSYRLQVLSFPQSKPRVVYIAATGASIPIEDPEDHRLSTTPLLPHHRHIPLHLHRRYPLHRCTQGLHLRPPLHHRHHCSGRPLPTPHPMVQG
ncbi:hypothetical protein BKA70DRAFT_1268287 [Coprinopsis sp. MPI-PUGE-AT-0042]|nr:hypothetical protein BKA70DRAFT_1268287 [Coprinopsis sp. MPI-PUGE-AT-0042]